MLQGYNNNVMLLAITHLDLKKISIFIVLKNIIHAIDTVKTKFGVVVEMGKKEITKSCQDI